MSIPHSFDPMGTAGALPPLPAPFKRVKCLISNCRQALDTGIVPDTTTRWELDYCFVDNADIDKAQRNGMTWSSGAIRFELSPISGAVVSSSERKFTALNDRNALLVSAVSSYTRAVSVLDATGFSVGGSFYPYASTTSNFPHSLGIFSRKSNYAGGAVTSWDCGCSEKVYGSRIYKGNSLIQDLVPALDGTGTPCFFDLVTERAFYAFRNINSPFVQLQYEL